MPRCDNSAQAFAGEAINARLGQNTNNDIQLELLAVMGTGDDANAREIRLPPTQNKNTKTDCLLHPVVGWILYFELELPCAGVT